MILISVLYQNTSTSRILELSPQCLLFSVVNVKLTVKIWSIFVAFLENMNFTENHVRHVKLWPYFMEYFDGHNRELHDRSVHGSHLMF